MPSNFKRSDVLATTTRAAIYGPVSSGVTAIVFAGTFSNVDTTNKSDHTFTLEIRNVSNVYIPILKDIPVPYGGSSKCPKLVLSTGEYLYVTSEANSVIEASVNLLEKS